MTLDLSSWIVPPLGAILGGAVALFFRKKLPNYFHESARPSSPVFLAVSTAIVSGLASHVALRFFNEAGPTVLVALVFAVVTPTLIVTDAQKHLLPNQILGFVTVTELAALIAGIIAADLVPQLSPVPGSGVAVGIRALLGALAFSAVMFLLTLLKTGLGLGDVKLAFPLGMMLASQSWTALFYGVILGWILAGIVAIALLVTRRAKRDTMIAYGPYMIVGAWTVWLLGLFV